MVKATSGEWFVFPTCVGVNRYGGWDFCEMKSVPHMRGGEPYLSLAAEIKRLCSPHAWG